MTEQKKKVNYQRITDETIGHLNGRPKLLLHSCCGPCSSYVLEYLSQYFEITVFYYNPNIRPREEFEKRLETQRVLLEKAYGQNGCPMELVAPEYDPLPFEDKTAGMEHIPEGGDRCTVCFTLRLDETARYAKENGFSWFCTTLSVSPHKDAERLNRIGAETAEKYGLNYLVSDFKKRSGYLRSIRLSEQYGLYRQDYCGCTPRAD